MVNNRSAPETRGEISMSEFIVVSLGMGVNSISMLVGMKERGISPDLILFADTGAERSGTYAYIPVLNEWLKKVGFPEIIIVSVTGELLVENCLRRKALPAVAYGFKTCSLRWKIEPQEKFLNNHDGAKAVWAAGNKVVKFIGIDALESHRARGPMGDQAKKYTNEFPLVEWGWGRDECIDAIAKEGLPVAGKSSCYCCPNMRKTEIMELSETEPDLMAKAIEMEKNADLTHIAGLGRTWRWSQLIATDDMFGFRDRGDDSCMACYDG